MLERIHEQGACRAEQVGGLAGHHGAVGHDHGTCRCACGFFLKQGRAACGGEVGIDSCLLHEQLQLGDLLFAHAGALHIHAGLEIAPHDFHACCLADGIVVEDRIARHVHSHVGGGVVGAFAQDLGEHGLKHGEDLDVAVVVDGGLPVGFQMEGVDGVAVVQVDGCRFVCDVHRMLQGQVPDGEGLVLGVACVDSALVLVVQLGKAGCHLARAGARGGYHDQRTGGFHVVVQAEALFACDMLDVEGVTGDGVVEVAGNAQAVHAVAEGIGVGLVGVLGDDDAADVEAHGAQDVHQAQYFLLVGDAQVAAHLALLDVVRVDGDDDFDVVDQALQHVDLGVGRESGEHARGMVVIEDLTAEFQVELSSEFIDSFPDVLRLKLDVFVVVETGSHALISPSVLFASVFCTTVSVYPALPGF